jgi:hypothetical protein
MRNQDSVGNGGAKDVEVAIAKRSIRIVELLDSSGRIGPHLDHRLIEHGLRLCRGPVVGCACETGQERGCKHGGCSKQGCAKHLPFLPRLN